MATLTPSDRRLIQHTFATAYGELKANQALYRAQLAAMCIGDPTPQQLQVSLSTYHALIQTLDQIRMKPEGRMLSGCKTYLKHLERMKPKLERAAQKGDSWSKYAALDYEVFIGWLKYFVEGVERNLST